STASKRSTAALFQKPADERRRALQQKTACDSERDERRHRERIARLQMLLVEQPHAAVHPANLPVRSRMCSPLSLQMRDRDIGHVPDLPSRLRRANAPVEVFAESEHLLIERTHGGDQFASGQQTASRYGIDDRGLMLVDVAQQIA